MHTLHSRLPYLEQELFGIVSGAGHYVLGHVSGKVRIAQKLGLGRPGLKNLVYHRLIVILPL